MGNKQTFIISLGGSLIVPTPEKPDVAFLCAFKNLLLKHSKNHQRFAITVGGGQLSRVWQNTAKEIGVESVRDLDWIGIRATQANAELVRTIFGKHAYKEVVCDHHKKVSSFEILIGAGFEPGCSTDYRAVLRAHALGAKTVINLSNIAHVYDKDPKSHPNAKPLKTLSWKAYLAMAGARWIPGQHMPFDPVAATFASKHNMTAVFMHGGDLENLENYLLGNGWEGTIIV